MTGSPVAFGPHLRSLRLAAQLTQEQLAERSGVSPRTIRDLERGTWKTPRFDTAKLLADALGLDGARREEFDAVVRNARPLRAGAPVASPEAPGGAPGALAALPPASGSPPLGRAAALADLTAMLAGRDARIVTLFGPGGVGKTRLALEAARRIAESGREVAWAPLEGLASPEEVLPAIARAVGAAGQPQADPVRRIADAVAGRKVLLVLDNVEHVIAAAGDVAAMVAAAPGLQVLATSREPLRIGGETRIPVAPLPVPAAGDDDAAAAANPAVALFLDRAALDVAGSAALADVRRMVTVLDGLPLAIELAAAQSEGVDPATVAALLERSGIGVLDAGRRDVPERLRSMDRAVRWSYDLLGKRERRLLRVLSVFRGGCDFALLAEVCERLGEPDLVSGLPGLVRASLVNDRMEAGDRPRISMLSPIRMFAEAALAAAGEADAGQRAHRQAMRDLARREWTRVMGPDVLAGLAAMDRERDNLTAALDHAIRVGDAADAMALAGGMALWWEFRGDVAEGFRWLERALAVPGDSDPVDVSRASRIAALFAVFLDRPDRWKAIAERMLADATVAGHVSGQAIALTWLADHAWYVGGDLDAARDLHQRAVDLVEPLGDEGDLAQALDRLGDVLATQGDLEDALRCFDRSIAIRRRLGQAIHLTAPLVTRAMALMALGRDAEARAGLLEAVEIGVRLAHQVAIAQALLLVGAIDARSENAGRRAAAARLIGAADALLGRRRVPLDPTLAPYRDRALADLSAALGEAERDRDLAAGRALSGAEAMALAGRVA